jgi:hypothetical protein
MTFHATFGFVPGQPQTDCMNGKFLSKECCSLIILAFVGSGCMKDKITKHIRSAHPFISADKIQESIRSGPAIPVEVTGKLTVLGKYIFLSEPQKGIHIIDNSNPANPQNISFINIPGNEDMAIRGNTLYADAYGDLVTFDISDPTKVIAKILQRMYFRTTVSTF